MGVFQGNIYSESLGMATQLYAYLPQDELAKRNRGKPSTLILLHGLTGNAASWVRRTNLDGLADQYNVAIFMPEVQRSFYTDLNPGLKYFSYVAKELPIIIKNMFNVNTDINHMMIAGLSMGGYGAMKCALEFPKKFSKVGAFSAMYRMEDYINEYKSDTSNPIINKAREDFYLMFGSNFEKLSEGDLHMKFEQTKDKLALPEIYFSCGLQDVLLPMSQNFHKLLEQHDVPHIYEEWDGNHEWNFWAESLKRMLKVFCV